MPGCRVLGRRFLLPQTRGWRWPFQYPVAAATAAQSSAHESKRRPFRASERWIFHHGSIRLRYAAEVGWKTTS